MTEPTDNSELTDRLFAELESTADEALTARLVADPALAAEMAALEATLGELQAGLQPLPETPRELRADQRQAVLDLAAQLDREAAAPIAGGGGAGPTTGAGPTLTLWSRIPVAMKLAASLAVCAGLAWLVVQSSMPDGPTGGSTVAMQDPADDAPAAPAANAEAEQADPAANTAKLKQKRNAETTLDMVHEVQAEELAADDAVAEDRDQMTLESASRAGMTQKETERQNMQARSAKEGPADMEPKRRQEFGGGGADMAPAGGAVAESLAQSAEPATPAPAPAEKPATAETFAATEPTAGGGGRERGASSKPAPAPMTATAPSVASLDAAKGDAKDLAKNDVPVLTDARVRVLGARKKETVAATSADGQVGRAATEGHVAGAVAPAAPPARQMAPAAAMADAADEADTLDEFDASAVTAAPPGESELDDTVTTSAEPMPGLVSVEQRHQTVHEALRAIGQEARFFVHLEGDRIVLVPRAYRISASRVIAPDPAMLRRLNEVRIPSFHLQNATVEAALNRLIAASREHDPDGVGIPAPLVQLSHPTTGRTLGYLPYHVAPLAALATADSATVAVDGHDVTFSLGAVPVEAATTGAAAAVQADIEAATRPADGEAGPAED